MGFARSEEVGVSQALNVPSITANNTQQQEVDIPSSNNLTIVKQASKESTDSSDK